MRIIRSLADIGPADRGATAAIGNFDGVHLGHQAVIAQARAAGDGPLAVVTFEPHPREIFQPGGTAFRLMDAGARATRLAKLGVDILYELPFEASLYKLSDTAFCQSILADGLGLSHVTVGIDFRYGAGRTGTTDTLQSAGAQMGFAVTIAALVMDGTGDVSSTAIRKALSDGDPETAARMLGHWHRIEGPVLHGEKRGRELGYPTANMAVTGRHLPRLGVYAVVVDVLDGPYTGQYGGAASLGVRPMFGENTPNLETYIFDFRGDLYGSTLSIGLVEFLRPELTFDGLDALIVQMDADCTKARDILDKV